MIGAAKAPTVEPVSYTHLDVYKRQDFITVTGGVYAAKYNVYGVRFNDLGAKGKLSFRINDRMKINMFGTYSVYNGYGMTCLLYTSRCV